MNRSQIAVGVGKGRVDLNGTRVTLEGAVDVLHLLQRIAHVAVGVGKGGLNSASTHPYIRGAERKQTADHQHFQFDSNALH